MVIMVICNVPGLRHSGGKETEQGLQSGKSRHKIRVCKRGKNTLQKPGFSLKQVPGNFQNFFAGSLMDELLLYCAESPLGIERLFQLLSLTILPI